MVNDKPIAMPPAHDSSPTVLLAEDDPVTRMLLTRQLKKAGYEVEAVADGAAALQKFKQQFYPFLLTDWEMPEMDGVSLCKAVRAMTFEGYVYTLLLTARDSKEHIIAGLEAGADDYLTKPIHEAELVARLNTGRRILNLEQSLRAASQENRRLSITDALTGAFNRRYLMEQLPREVDRCRRYGHALSVVLCDIDHFKRVNDSFGHSVGDAVLTLFVERIRSLTREGVDWIARYGGEEFVIVLPETPYAGGMMAAEKLRAAIAASTLPTTCGDLSITASFGVAAINPENGFQQASADRLIRGADEFLYEAKQRGRNRVAGAQLSDQAMLRSCALTS
jgi:two-component system cell cycle response regulator